MKIKKKENLGEIQKEHMYFCPFCKILFIEDKNCVIFKNNKVNCLQCKKKFDMSEFGLIASQPTNSFPYSFPKDSNIKSTPFEYIKEKCQAYYDDGYSYRKIHKMTFFSLELIQKCIAIKKTFKEPRICKEEQLLSKYLKIKKKDTSNENIKKALEFGCCYKVIEKLFKVSSKTITAVKKELSAEKKLRPTAKVSLHENDYKISYSKNLEKE